MLRYAIPVFDREKQNRGILVLNVLADYLLKNILTYKFLNGIDSYLLDKSGFYLLHPDISKQWGGQSDLNTGENMKNDFRQEISSLVLAGHSGSELMDDYFFNFIPIHYGPLNGERYWIFMESIHKSIVYSPVYSFSLVFGILVFLLLTGGVTSTFFLSRKLTKPLKELVKGVTSIGKGNLDYHITVTSKDEIALLSSSFNEMTSQLSESRKQLQDYAFNLEQKVEDKTNEIKHMLNELTYKNKEMEQIIYVTSHDMRSPLLNIRGFSKELQESLEQMRTILHESDIPTEIREKFADPLEEDIPDAIKFILASSSKMDALLSGFLRISRMGRVVLAIKQLDMSKLISNVIGTYEYKIKEANVKLQIDELPSCRGDDVQINQVFSNLLDNALKYHDSNREGIIRISGKKEDERIVYCLEDNGIGIAERHQDKVFEIFHRLNLGDSVVGEGLGLAIVRKILDRHRGKIWVESEQGKGSKFFVSLPA